MNIIRIAVAAVALFVGTPGPWAKVIKDDNIKSGDWRP
jgi:hypothetical protein